jgi:galactokinase
MTEFPDPILLLAEQFGPGPTPSVVSVPGRVNLIGEHIDYHNLPVLPIAIQRRIRVAFRPRDDRRIRAVSSGSYGRREFDWKGPLQPGESGDWVNYIKAAAQAVDDRWKPARGVDAAIVSDLPPAAGLSSSSALLVAMTLALLQANGISASFEELMEVLPEGEYFVGTRGGGMDHAAVLAARAGSAVLIRFAPVSVAQVPIPKGWAFLVAHSLTTAEKSGAVKAQYNSRRTAGTRALGRLGFAAYSEAMDHHTFDELRARAVATLDEEELPSFLHVVGEAFRVREAVAALKQGDAASFGRILYSSHESLRDLLGVSCPALDSLVAAARRAGALGARLTGAGFGGCAVVFSEARDRERVRAGLIKHYYSGQSGFDPEMHLIDAEPSEGALA